MRFEDPFTDRLIGSLLGLISGDALGMPVEGLTWPQIQQNHGWLARMIDGRFPAGTFTDDGQMALGLVESLIQAGGFDPAVCAARWLANFQPERGYGNRIHLLMSRLAEGAAWDSVATDSWGNGAAMRVGPLGAYLSAYARTRPGIIINAALASARITHRHPEAEAGAAIIALAVGRALALAINGQALEAAPFLAWLSQAASALDQGMMSRLAALEPIIASPERDAEALRERLSSAFACNVRTGEAVPPALAAFLLTKSLEEALCLAVNLGGDTDTIAAMAGSMAGAYYGASAIPERWWAALENGSGSGRDYGVGLCLVLAPQVVRATEPGD